MIVGAAYAAPRRPGILFIAGVGRIQFKKHFNQMNHQRAHVLRKLAGMDVEDPKNKEQLRDAFDIFDTDHNGTLDEEEMAILLRAHNPKLSKKAALATVSRTGRHARTLQARTLRSLSAQLAI